MFIKRALSGLLLIGLGISIAILMIEAGLRVIPESTWKKMLSRNPWRHILFEVDKNIGWVHVPNVRMNWTGNGEYDVDVQINSAGLRDYEHTYEKSPGTFRILILGDSFTEAIQVPLEQTFPVQLEKCLAGRMAQRVEVINAGVSGYGPGEELLFFRHQGVKYQPDLVLVAIFIGNDILNMRVDSGSTLLEVTGGYQFFLQDGQLKQRWVDWAGLDPNSSELERFFRRNSRLYYVLKSPDSRVPHWWEDVTESWGLELARAENATFQIQKSDELPGWPAYADDPRLIIFARNFPDNPVVSPNIRELWELFKAPFLELQTQVEAPGAKLAAIIIPMGPQVHKTMYDDWVAGYTETYPGLRPEDWDVAAPDKAIEAFLLEHHIPVLDLLPGFQAYTQVNDELIYFPRDGHFNEKGHFLTAELTCNWLVENQWGTIQIGKLGKEH